MDTDCAASNDRWSGGSSQSTNSEQGDGATHDVVGSSQVLENIDCCNHSKVSGCGRLNGRRESASGWILEGVHCAIRTNLSQGVVLRADLVAYCDAGIKSSVFVDSKNVNTVVNRN